MLGIATQTYWGILFCLPRHRVRGHKLRRGAHLRYAPPPLSLQLCCSDPRPALRTPLLLTTAQVPCSSSSMNNHNTYRSRHGLVLQLRRPSTAETTTRSSLASCRPSSRRFHSHQRQVCFAVDGPARAHKPLYAVRCRMTAQAIVRCRGNLCVCPVRVCMEPMRGIVSINYKHVPFALKYRLPRLLRVAIFWVANPNMVN